MKNLLDVSKKTILLSLLAFIFISLTACANKPQEDLLQKVMTRGKIIAGVKFDAKPFGYIDENQALQGFDIDLVKEIAKRILGSENAVEFQQVTSSSRIISLTSGRIDLAAASMTITDKRSRIIDFSIPYHETGQALMVSVNSPVRYIKDLNYKRVIVILGSTAEENIRNLAPEAIILGFRTYTDAFSALRAGRADALTTDSAILAGLVSEDSGYKMLKERYTKEFYGIGFKKSDDTKSFQNAVNSALEGIRADGTLERIKRKWMPE